MAATKHSVLFFLLIPLFSSFLVPASVQARPIHLNARSAILVDMKDGAILFEQNADAPIAPASITKVLSLYVVFEAIRRGEVRLWDTVHVSRQAAATRGSSMGLRIGDEVPLKEIIKGMAVVSGNDACVAVAEHVSGGVENFVREMNGKARELGMTNSFFKTPHGLPADGQLTSARDVALLSLAYLSRYPESLHIHSQQTYTYTNRVRHNANRLLGRCHGVDGLKTGFVSASGYNLAATAKRGDTRLIAVVLGTQSPAIRARETERLLEFGFRLLERQESPAMEARNDGNRIVPSAWSTAASHPFDTPGSRTASTRTILQNPPKFMANTKGTAKDADGKGRFERGRVSNPVKSPTARDKKTSGAFIRTSIPHPAEASRGSLSPFQG